MGGCTGYLVGAGLLAAGMGGYALVGMAAAIAASTHAPLMATVLAFELSADYAVVLPLVLATAVATAVARQLSRDSIYTDRVHSRERRDLRLWRARMCRHERLPRWLQLRGEEHARPSRLGEGLSPPVSRADEAVGIRTRGVIDQLLLLPVVDGAVFAVACRRRPRPAWCRPIATGSER